MTRVDLSAFGRRFIRDAVYAANDGVVTTFAVVAGVRGGDFGPRVLLVLGFANLAADGLSMAIGNYLGIKSERAALLGSAYVEKVERRNAAEHGLVTWAAFVAAGLMPLLPYLLPGSLSLPVEHRFLASVGASAVTLFAIGSLRTRVTGRPWLASGLEMLLVGGLAGAAAFGAGLAAERLLQG